MGTGVGRKHGHVGVPDPHEGVRLRGRDSARCRHGIGGVGGDGAGRGWRDVENWLLTLTLCQGVTSSLLRA
jgi:hypothetical protein